MLKDTNGKWACFVAHSSHEGASCGQNEKGELIPIDRIGDVTLSIDNKGNIYQSHRHVCSEILSYGIAGKNRRGLHDINYVIKNWMKIE